MSAPASPPSETAPVDDEPPYDCPYCDRQFHRRSYLDLHRGQDHAATMTDAEREAFETARDEEVEALRLFRLQALAALVFIYFGFLLVYAFSL